MSTAPRRPNSLFAATIALLVILVLAVSWAAAVAGDKLVAAEEAFAKGRNAKAERLLLAILDDAEGGVEDDPRITSAVVTLARLYTNMGKPEAESYYRRGLEATARQWGPNHPEVGDVLISLVGFYLNQQRREDAEHRLGQALSIYEQEASNEKLVTVADTLFQLATFLQNADRASEATPFFDGSLRLLETAEDVERTALLITTMLEHHTQQGEFASVANLLDRLPTAGRIADEDALITVAVTLVTLAEDQPEVMDTARFWEQALEYYVEADDSEAVPMLFALLLHVYAEEGEPEKIVSLQTRFPAIGALADEKLSEARSVRAGNHEMDPAGSDPPVDSETAPATTTARIGVYDPRVVAAAYYSSDVMEQVVKQHIEARLAGDEKLHAELDAQRQAMATRMQKQITGRAPVDDILEHINDALPGIMENAGVSQIVSLADGQTLADYGSAERVDITKPIVGTLNSQMSYETIVARLNPEVSSEFQRHYEAGATAADAGDFEDAIAELETALEIHPDLSSLAWHKLAYCYQNVGRRADAWIAIRKAIILNPGDPQRQRAFNTIWNSMKLEVTLGTSEKDVRRLLGTPDIEYSGKGASLWLVYGVVTLEFKNGKLKAISE